MTNLEARKIIYHQLERVYMDLPNEIDEYADDPVFIEALVQFLDEFYQAHDVLFLMYDCDAEIFANIPEIRYAVVTLLNRTKANHTKRLCLRFLESTLTAP